MDFATLRAKLDDGSASVSAFISDVRLTYRNAVTYNWEADNVVADAAIAGLSTFERLLPIIIEGKGARGAAEWLAQPPAAAGGEAKKPRASIEPRARRTDDEHMHHLLDFVLLCGGNESMLDGWYTKTDLRQSGNSAGTTDTYFISDSGQRFRARTEVVKHLRLDYRKGDAALKERREAVKAAAKEVERAAAAANRAATSEARAEAKRLAAAAAEPTQKKDKGKTRVRGHACACVPVPVPEASATCGMCTRRLLALLMECGPDPPFNRASQFIAPPLPCPRRSWASSSPPPSSRVLYRTRSWPRWGRRSQRCRLRLQRSLTYGWWRQAAATAAVLAAQRASCQRLQWATC